MQKRNIYSRLTELSNKFNCENIEKTKQINKTKFDTLRQWSLDNGALFNHSIEFPIAYGPFGYYGVKAKIDINSNEAIIFVPRKQMIISKDYEDKFPFIKVTEEKDDNGKVLISGFNMTRSITYVLSKPNKFIRIDNANPLDDAKCYSYVYALKYKPMKYFSKPLKV